jgi:hypothetical protein
MSTRLEIVQLQAAGKLVPFMPRTRQPAKRRLYLTQPALNDLTNAASATNLLSGRGFIEAALTRWTAGDRVYGDRRRGRFLCRLEPPPPEIWEIRVTEPVVQCRLLGRFAEPDTLILMKFYTRPLLGKKGSTEWMAGMRSCQTQWNELFPETGPFSAKEIHQYVTENCDDFPI